jgi:hypothetical protein
MSNQPTKKDEAFQVQPPIERLEACCLPILSGLLGAITGAIVGAITGVGVYEITRGGDGGSFAEFRIIFETVLKGSVLGVIIGANVGLIIIPWMITKRVK